MSDDVSVGLDISLEQLLRSRWSCRAFRPDPVPHEILVRLLSIAQRSASWCNTQPWQTIITEGSGTDEFRASLAEHIRSHGIHSNPDYPMPGEYQGVYRERRRTSGWQLYEAVGVARGDRAASAVQAAKNYELFGAPHVAIVTVDANHAVYGVLDSGIYIGSFLLAAQSLGLGAIPQAAIARLAPFVREFFHIPETKKTLLAISLGYPADSHPANGYRTDRADLDEVVQWHRGNHTPSLVKDDADIKKGTEG